MIFFTFKHFLWFSLVIFPFSSFIAISLLILFILYLINLFEIFRSAFLLPIGSVAFCSWHFTCLNICDLFTANSHTLGFYSVGTLWCLVWKWVSKRTFFSFDSFRYTGLLSTQIYFNLNCYLEIFWTSRSYEFKL